MESSNEAKTYYTMTELAITVEKSTNVIIAYNYIGRCKKGETHNNLTFIYESKKILLENMSRRDGRKISTYRYLLKSTVIILLGKN